MSRLPRKEQDEVIAFLFHLRHSDQSDYQKDVTKRLGDSDASHWLTPDQFELATDITTPNEYVQVSFGGNFNQNDKDAPILKVTSTPKDGSKVKAGKRIDVVIRASETYEDGHKSWPTGCC